MSFSMHDGGEDSPVSDINVTPLVDVMLVLLIVFMITMPVPDPLHPNQPADRRRNREGRRRAETERTDVAVCGRQGAILHRPGYDPYPERAAGGSIFRRRHQKTRM